jgi:hypothetical protein
MAEARFVDEFEFGFGWIHPRPGFLRRASHALAADGRVWLFDPTDVDGLDERITALGESAGVIQQFHRHERRCADVARRLGVPLHRLSLGDAPFEAIPLGRDEIAVWWPETRTLIVAEAVGTSAYYRTPGERLGVHPFRRLRPPRELLATEPEHLLVGHGAGLHGPPATAELQRAVAEALRRTPLLPLTLLPRRR